MKIRIKSLIILSLLTSQLLNAQSFIFEKTPKWVKTIEIPKKSALSKYDINSGYYLKLYDYQANLENETQFFHEVRNIVSYSGITNASQLAITYDTSYQKLVIHHLYIWRNGKKIDRTNDLTLEVLNNENNLQQGIYSGNITAYDILNDIRQDDLIDFAYSVIGDNPIFNKEKYLFIPLESTNPMDLYSVIIVYPEENNYRYNCVDCDSLAIIDTVINGYKHIEICNKNLKAYKIEDNVPSWLIEYKYFTLSSMKSWSDVNKWAQNVFSLQKKPELQSVFDEIFTGNETQDEKIDKIINYVQDEIRYMGIETGIGSIKPFHPNQVVEQRFGDCKDKSLLLVSLLKDININTAYPALVNTIMLQNTEVYTPSNQIFNHCIVTFEYNDSTYWIDPTIMQQGGNYKNMYIPDYGKALIVGKPSDSLQNMPNIKVKGGAFIEEDLTINSFTKPAELIIKSSRKGIEADRRRNYFEYYTIENLSEIVTKDLKRLFPKVKELKKMEISDDIIKNDFTVIYDYQVDDFWIKEDVNEYAKNFWMFKYEPLVLYQYINETTCEDREFDYKLNYPMYLNYKMTFHFPKDILIFDDYNRVNNDAFYFEKNIKQIDKRTLLIDYTFEIKSEYIKAADYKKICEQKNAIAKKLPLVIYFAK